MTKATVEKPRKYRHQIQGIVSILDGFFLLLYRLNGLGTSHLAASREKNGIREERHEPPLGTYLGIPFFCRGLRGDDRECRIDDSVARLGVKA